MKLHKVKYFRNFFFLKFKIIIILIERAVEEEDQSYVITIESIYKTGFTIKNPIFFSQSKVIKKVSISWKLF